MSTSSGSSVSPFPRAIVYWTSPKRSSRPREAWLSISSFLRWKYVESKGGAPENFSSFRGHQCLALNRLPENAKWKDVEDVVSQFKSKRGYAVIVKGTFSGRNDSCFGPRTVDLVLVAESEVERNVWMDSIRIRISPWRLLYRRTKRMLIDSSISSNVLRAMFNCVRSTITELPDSTNSSSEISVNIELFGPVMEGVNVFSGFVETVATVVKKGVPLVKDTAENVADIAKCVTLVSSAFQVVALCASLAEMGLETIRGYEEWPRLLSQVEELRFVTAESMLPVIHPDGFVNELLVKHVFEVQEEVMDMLVGIEKEAMRSGCLQSLVRFLKSHELKIAEEKMKRLKSCVVDVVQSAGIAENTKAASDIRKEVQEVSKNNEALLDIKETIVNQSAHMEEVAKNTKALVGVQKVAQDHARNVSSPCLRPGLSPYFVGREEELGKLKTALDRYGSAAIMQYGGVGKTQLMVAFAECSERRGWVPGGCYWIRAHGDRAQFVESVARFAESLSGNPLMNNDRKDLSVILGSLKKTLDEFTGRWLLCVDNADSSDVNAALGEVCSLVKECTSQGWVIVTSRQGGKTLWRGMMLAQKLKLEPLGVEQTMKALLRWKEGLLEVEVSDAEMMKKLELLKRDDSLEYEWLLKLSTNDKTYGLGGLPLAIAQAGCFIHRHDFSFSKYASLYGEMRHCKEVLRLFPEVDDRGLEEKNQRMIWATWKANLDQLSKNARQVLFAFALFDHISVPEELVRGLDLDFSNDDLAYTEIVRGELVDGASFLQESRNGERVMFGMHCLIREFIHLEIKASGGNCIDALARAARSSLKAVNSTGRSTHDETFRVLLSHILSILIFVSDDQFSLGSSFPFPFLLLKLYYIGTDALSVLGRTMEASPLCRGWFRLLREVYGENRDNRDDMNALRVAGFVMMNNGAHDVAEKLVLKYLEVSERVHGKESDHVDIAKCFRQLGCLAGEKGQFDEAEKWYRKSLEMMLRMYGQEVDHMDVACVMDTLGVIIADQGLFEEAERWHRRSLGMMKRLIGEDADDDLVLKALNSLGQCCLEKGDVDEAEQLFHQCLEMHRRIHGANVDHVDVSKVLKNLGCTEFSKGNYSDAGDWYLRCYKMRLRLHGQGTDHPDVARILLIMARNDYKQDDSKEAIRKLQECIGMECRIYGDECPVVVKHTATLEEWKNAMNVRHQKKSDTYTRVSRTWRRNPTSIIRSKGRRYTSTGTARRRLRTLARLL